MRASHCHFSAPVVFFKRGERIFLVTAAHVIEDMPSAPKADHGSKDAGTREFALAHWRWPFDLHTEEFSMRSSATAIAEVRTGAWSTT